MARIAITVGEEPPFASVDARSLDALLPAQMAAKAEDVGVTKATLDTVSLFVLAVLAGAFISLGAIFATTVSAGTGDLTFGLVRVMAGLAFSLGWAPAEFWAAIERAPAEFSNLTVEAFLVRNLLPVTIGNVIGGAVMVGVVYWFVYLRGRTASGPG